MPTISIRIDEKLKKKMDELSYINWSEVIRRKIEEVCLLYTSPSPRDS